VNEKSQRQVIFPHTLDFAGEIPERGYVVIQTTSVGLYPDWDSAPVDDGAFYDKAAAGIDIIYNPANTAFMKKLQSLGKPAYNGLKMLLYQGVAAFELWNNLKVSDDVINQVYDKMKKAMNIDE
ncbi:MAG: shikimate dehydrogenase, partial [Lachnospiraceae bacterium]